MSGASASALASDPHSRTRYRIVDRAALAEALGVALPALADVHRQWVEAALRGGAAPL